MNLSTSTSEWQEAKTALFRTLHFFSLQIFRSVWTEQASICSTGSGTTKFEKILFNQQFAYILFIIIEYDRVTYLQIPKYNVQITWTEFFKFPGISEQNCICFHSS